MKNRVCFVLLTILLWSCESQTIKTTGGCIPVVQIGGICGQAVLQIQDPDLYHFGEDSDGYEHVFLATLECNAPQIESGKTFYVQLNPDNFNTSCATCLAAVDYSGSKKYPVRVFNSCSNKE
ncbi:MAG: hypothetical protein KF763_05295 [Cyclobacteriaceae bacterium]|nr:hypothetical protein [Cyclobacteriaceae bacterium]